MRGISDSPNNIAARVRPTIILTLIVTLLPAARAAAQLTFACTPDNDVLKLVSGAKRLDTAAKAIDAAPQGTGVLILSGDLTPDLAARARTKRLRLYVERAASGPNTRTAIWERGVVSSDFFGDALPKLRIVAPQACTFALVPKSDVTKTHLVIARVAGYDTAVYGMPAETFPLLYQDQGGNLIATATLSNFVTARFAPSAEWKHIWRTILHELEPTRKTPTLDVEPLVRPSNSTDERETLRRAASFFLNSRLLLTPDRRDAIHKLLAANTETTDVPTTAANGDGSLGILEGYASAIRPDGSQPQRTPIRSDCCAESAMVLSLDPSNTKARTVATNLLTYTFGPEMQSLGRLDPKHPAFGTIAWGAISPAWQVGNYGDDDARVMQAAILASAAMNTDQFDTYILRALLANLRTTGTKGFRGDRVDVPPLEQLGWRHFHDADTVNYSPHFESGLWACFIWAYARTGDKEFLDRTKIAIAMTMDAYTRSEWRWNDNMERSRMLLCLAWLVRVDDTPQHRAWLTTIATDLLKSQDAKTGAIADRLANAGGGHYRIPDSNEAYGTTETPLIQKNGDPVSDQLYSTGFALLGLHEAFGATGDETLRAAEDKLAAYLCRIQIRSEKLPYLDGGWFRAFDFGRWEAYASSADLGWGAWSVEAGWGPAWTAATLALRDRKTTMWEMTASSRIKDRFDAVRAEMAQNDGGPLKR
jgi:hypothetical protein